MSNARWYSLLLLSVTSFGMSAAWFGEAAWGKTSVKKTSIEKRAVKTTAIKTTAVKTDIATRRDFKEPVKLMSKDGVL